MKIIVKCDVSEDKGTVTFTPSDFSLSNEEWDMLSPDEKRDYIIEGLDAEPSQPYWVLNTFKETN